MIYFLSHDQMEAKFPNDLRDYESIVDVLSDDDIDFSLGVVFMPFDKELSDYVIRFDRNYIDFLGDSITRGMISLFGKIESLRCINSHYSFRRIKKLTGYNVSDFFFLQNVGVEEPLHIYLRRSSV